MAVTVADLEIVVGADTSEAESALGGLSGNIKDASKSGGGFLSKLTGGFGGLTKTAMKTIGVVGGLTSLPILGGGVKAAWDQVSSVEQATVALRAYEKDASKVDAVLGDLLAYARSDAGVLFNRTELFAAAQSMKMYGAETENLADYTKILSRSVGLGLSNWTDLNRVIGRVGSTGRLTGEDFDYLRAAGFQLDDSLRNTNITWDELFTALDQGIPADAMAGQADTIRGKMIRLQSAMRNLGLAILGVDADTSKFIKGGLGDMLFNGISKATAALNALAPLFGMVASAAAQGLQKIGSVIGPVFDGFIAFLEKFYELKDVHGVVRGAMYALADVLTSALGPKVANTVLNALLKIEQGVKTVVGAIRSGFGVLKDFGSYLKDVWKGGNTLTKSLNKLPRPLRNFAKNVGTVVDAFGDLRKAYQRGGFKELWKELPKELRQVGDAFKGIGRNIMNGLRAAFNAIDWRGLASDALNRARSAFDAVLWSDIFNVLRSAGSWVVSKLGNITSSLVSWFTSQVQSVDWMGLLEQAWDVISGVGSTIVSKLGDIAGDLSDWFSDHVASIDWQGLLESGIGTLADVAVSIGSWAINAIRDLGSAVWDWITGTAWPAVRNVATNLPDVLVSIGSWVVNAVADLWDAVSSWVTDTAWPAVKDAVISLPDVIVKVGSWLVKTGAHLWGAIWGWVTGTAWPKVKDAAIWHYGVILKIGEWLVEAAKDLWKAIKDFVSKLWKGEKNTDYAEVDGVKVKVTKWDFHRDSESNFRSDLKSWLDEQVKYTDEDAADHQAIGEQHGRLFGKSFSLGFIAGFEKLLSGQNPFGGDGGGGKGGHGHPIYAAFKNYMRGFLIGLDDSLDEVMAPWLNEQGIKLELMFRDFKKFVREKWDEFWSFEWLKKRIPKLPKIDFDFGQWLQDTFGEGFTNFKNWIVLEIMDLIERFSNLIDAYNELPMLPDIPNPFKEIIEGATDAETGIIDVDDALTDLSGNSIDGDLGLAVVEAEARKAEQAINAAKGAMEDLNNLMTGNIMRPTPAGRGVAEAGGSPYADPYRPHEGGGSGVEMVPIDDLGGGNMFRSIVKDASFAEAAVRKLDNENAKLASNAPMYYGTVDSSANTHFGGVKGAADTNLPVVPTSFKDMATAILAHANPAFASVALSATNNFSGVKGAAATHFTGMVDVIKAQTAGAKLAAAVNLASMKSTVDTETAGAKTKADSNASLMARLVKSHSTAMARDARTQASAMNRDVSAQTLAMQIATVAKTALMQATMARHFTSMTSSARTASNNIVSTLQKGMSDASSAITREAGRWPSLISAAAGPMAAAGRAVGAAAGQGVASGLWGAVGSVRAAANAIISEVDRAMRAKARIKSPSRMTMYIGRMMGEGIAVGFDQSATDVVKATNALIGDTLGDLTLASKPMFALGHTLGEQLVDGLISGLTAFEDAFVDILSDAMMVEPSARLAFANDRTPIVVTPQQSAPQQIVIHQTNHYTVQVDDLEDLNNAVEFVRDLDRERQLVFVN